MSYVGNGPSPPSAASENSVPRPVSARNPVIPRRRTLPNDAIVVGRPRLQVRDEDCDTIADALAELLLELLELDERRELDWDETREEPTA